MNLPSWEGPNIDTDHWKTNPVNPAVNGYLFRIREGGSERTGKGGDMPKTQWASNPLAAMAIRLCKTSNFLGSYSRPLSSFGSLFSTLQPF